MGDTPPEIILGSTGGDKASAATLRSSGAGSGRDARERTDGAALGGPALDTGAAGWNASLGEAGRASVLEQKLDKRRFLQSRREQMVVRSDTQGRNPHNIAHMYIAEHAHSSLAV